MMFPEGRLMKLFGNTIRRAIEAFRHSKPTPVTTQIKPSPDLVGPWILVEVLHVSFLICLVAVLSAYVITPAVKQINLILNFGQDPSPYVSGFFWGLVSYYILDHFWRQIGMLWRRHVMPQGVETKIVQAISPYFGHKLGWAIRAWKGQ